MISNLLTMEQIIGVEASCRALVECAYELVIN